jgi:hypothetical protein
MLVTFLPRASPLKMPDALDLPLTVQAVGNVQTGILSGWQHETHADAGTSFPNFDYWYRDDPTGIVGCEVDLSPFFVFQTCPSQGFDGWVKAEFTLRRNIEWVGVRPPVRFDDFLFTFGDFTGPRCTIGGGQPGTCTELPYRRVMRP